MNLSLLRAIFRN